MSNNYSRWLKESELKEARDVRKVNYQEEIEVSGMPLFLEGKNMIVDTSVTSKLVIGATGSGKTQSTILPMLRLIARASESVIVTDPNGELYSRTASDYQKRGYNIVTLNFKDSQYGAGWNPLAYPYYLYNSNRKDEAIQLIENLGHSLLSERSTTDPFWENTAANYFTALCLGLFKDGKEEEINLNSVSAMISNGEEKIGMSTYAKAYFERFDKNDIAYINASSTIYAPTETRGSIISVLRQKLSAYLSRESLSQMISKSTFDLNELRNKTVVYIILPDNNRSINQLVNAFLEQSYYAISQANSSVKFSYLLDDFDMLSQINNLDMMITSGRSKNICFMLLTRNYQNIYDNYGKENGCKIINACSDIYYLLTDNRSTAEEISAQCGFKSINEPLISTDELLRISQWESILLKMRYYPIKIKLTPDYKIDWNEIVEEIPIETRESNEINIFNMKQSVTIEEKSLDNLIKEIDLKIEELENDDSSKTIIEKNVKKVEIEKDRVVIYFE